MKGDVLLKTFPKEDIRSLFLLLTRWHQEKGCWQACDWPSYADIMLSFNECLETMHKCNNKVIIAFYVVRLLSSVHFRAGSIAMLYQWNTLQWRNNEHDSVSNHQPHDCLLNRLFRRRSKKTSKLRVTGFCVGNSPVTGEFPAQMASNAGNVPCDDAIMRFLTAPCQIEVVWH